MIRFYFLLFFPLLLSASTILNYNIYDRTDRVDVMITFDTPYTGIISQSVNTNNIIIKLQDAKIESAKTKKLSSTFLNTLSITPMAGYTQIFAVVPPSVVLKASKTSDGYGLRLRFTNVTQPAQASTPQAQGESPLSSLPTKQDGDMSTSYYIVVTILILGILYLFYIKRKVNSAQAKSPSPWLQKSNAKQSAQNTQNTGANEVRIRFQKSIDNDNSVVMLDFASQSYLILMGKSNILLDTFTDNKPTSQSEFETILQNRHQELDDFLHAEVSPKQKEAFQSYREKASSISYDV